MAPLVHCLITLGQWAQTHQDLVLISSLGVVALFSTVRLTAMVARQTRRGRR